MRFGTVLFEGQERVACLLDAAEVALMPAGSRDLAALIAEGDAGLAAVRGLVRGATAQRVPLSAVRVLAPLRRLHRDVLCTGWNYWDHFYEGVGKREGQEVPKPEAPTFFTKGPGVVIGPHDDIAFDAKLSAKWDYEAEIVVVIGKTGRSIPKERAMHHVWGYCLANDVSQRDLQRRHGGQWLKGKSIDATMPLGPWIVARDAIDLQQVTLECELNGKVMQRAGASEMAFSVAELISELSFGMTLRAGDILLTGTPSGVGHARTPPVFLNDGDELRVRATGLGELHNRVRATDLSSYEA